MNSFANSLCDWNYTAIVNTEKKEKNDGENTDDKDFLRTKSNSNKCDEVIASD